MGCALVAYYTYTSLYDELRADDPPRAVRRAPHFANVLTAVYFLYELALYAARLRLVGGPAAGRPQVDADRTMI